jgi:dihydroxyacid dehydratase/phosphogluconate dehydratase
MSLGETLLRPTAMLFRNLASMDVEESIRGNPIDGVVLLMGCDKTTPSLLMGVPAICLPLAFPAAPCFLASFAAAIWDREQDCGR